MRWIDWIGTVQGLFYVATGLWPLFNMRTFMMVTGPKTDTWLVRTVALLIVVIGAALVLGSRGADTDRGIVLLGLCSPVALMAVDIYYSVRGVIRKVYLLDAVAEAPFVLYWLWIAWSGRLAPA